MKKPYSRKSNLKIHTAELAFRFEDWIAELEPRKAANRLLEDAENGNGNAKKYVNAFVTTGVTETLIKRIDSKLRKIDFAAQLRRTQGALTFEWRVGAPEPGQLAGEVYYALLALLAISYGEARRFKECEYCKKRFLGNAKAKYCSNNCGSQIRVRRKRAKDKKRKLS